MRRFHDEFDLKSKNSLSMEHEPEERANVNFFSLMTSDNLNLKGRGPYTCGWLACFQAKRICSVAIIILLYGRKILAALNLVHFKNRLQAG